MLTSIGIMNKMLERATEERMVFITDLLWEPTVKHS